MNILLHVCCAPCAIYPIEQLKKASHRASGFFYNPNIHPYSEYQKRKSEVEKYFRETGIGLLRADYDLEKYFQRIAHNETPAKRCPACWSMRLEKCAEYAKDIGFDAFTTTLLGSPYQDQGILKSIGMDTESRTGVKFYCEDFKAGFKKAHDIAKSRGIYCQNYCGCVFSERERIEKKASLR